MENRENIRNGISVDIVEDIFEDSELFGKSALTLRVKMRRISSEN